jgi:hypothetical protein
MTLGISPFDCHNKQASVSHQTYLFYDFFQGYSSPEYFDFPSLKKIILLLKRIFKSKPVQATHMNSNFQKHMENC